MEDNKNKFSKNVISSRGFFKLGPPTFQSDVLRSELTCQVLVEGYLTCLLLVHQLTFGLFRA